MANLLSASSAVRLPANSLTVCGWTSLRKNSLTLLTSITQSSTFKTGTRTSQPSLTSRARRDEAAASEAAAISRQMVRDWQPGDVYAPHDLSAAESRKWRKRIAPTLDAFDALNVDPLTLYKNFSVLSEYVTEMGRIRHRSSTGLRRVNQRKIAKAIRRAISLGLMPSVHRHPEVMKIAMRKAGEQGHII